MNMKKIYLIIISIICFSCDKIEPPYTENISQPPERTVLIEKFTGHKCSGCPNASDEVYALKQLYGEDAIISIAIHPGDLSVFTAVDENHPYDFTTLSGDSIANDMGITFLPLGTINRIPNGSASGNAWYYEDWGSEIQNLLFSPDSLPLEKNININLNTTLNEINKELTIETSISFLNNNLSGNYKLCLIITEDGIISPQDDDNKGIIGNYEHNDIYRCAVNGTYGESIENFAFVDLEGQAGYQSTHTVIFNESSNINWTDEWTNMSNCSVVAYVYDDKSLIIEESVKKPISNE
tara:strand:+ start:3042 stop:3926 length:885 start_codon:yes stop_codon:yes gene_type:complete